LHKHDSTFSVARRFAWPAKLTVGLTIADIRKNSSARRVGRRKLRAFRRVGISIRLDPHGPAPESVECLLLQVLFLHLPFEERVSPQRIATAEFRKARNASARRGLWHRHGARAVMHEEQLEHALPVCGGDCRIVDLVRVAQRLHLRLRNSAGEHEDSRARRAVAKFLDRFDIEESALMKLKRLEGTVRELARARVVRKQRGQRDLD
jgi:hypothetical protein